MAKIEFKGIDAYTARLSELSALAKDKVIGTAIYDGAEVVTDAVRQALEALPTEESWGTEARRRTGLTQEEKAGLLSGLGVASLQTDAKGFTNVKIGFDGYSGKPTHKYPRGKPNVMLARAVISGTSFLEGHNFVKEGVRRSRKAAEAAMAKRVEQEIEKIMK